MRKRKPKDFRHLTHGLAFSPQAPKWLNSNRERQPKLISILLAYFLIVRSLGEWACGQDVRPVSGPGALEPFGHVPPRHTIVGCDLFLGLSRIPSQLNPKKPLAPSLRHRVPNQNQPPRLPSKGQLLFARMQ